VVHVDADVLADPDAPGQSRFWYNLSPARSVRVTTIEPTGHILGATVRRLDLSEPLSDADFAAILQALGAHGVLHFPDQKLEARALRDFSQRFGRIQATLTGRHHEPGMPEVGILSTSSRTASRSGSPTPAKTGTRTMSYNETIGFLNVLYAVKVPRRDGRVLGATMCWRLFVTTVRFRAKAVAPMRISSTSIICPRLQSWAIVSPAMMASSEM
jgi:hypothetical protein